jgi:hypothetical protein
MEAIYLNICINRCIQLGWFITGKKYFLLLMFENRHFYIARSLGVPDVATTKFVSTKEWPPNSLVTYSLCLRPSGEGDKIQFPKFCEL